MTDVILSKGQAVAVVKAMELYKSALENPRQHYVSVSTMDLEERSSMVDHIDDFLCWLNTKIAALPVPERKCLGNQKYR